MDRGREVDAKECIAMEEGWSGRGQGMVREKGDDTGVEENGL